MKSTRERKPMIVNVPGAITSRAACVRTMLLSGKDPAINHHRDPHSENAAPHGATCACRFAELREIVPRILLTETRRVSCMNISPVRPVIKKAYGTSSLGRRTG